MENSRRAIFCLILALVAVVMLTGPAFAADGLGGFSGGDSDDLWTAILGFCALVIIGLYLWFFLWREK